MQLYRLNLLTAVFSVNYIEIRCELSIDKHFKKFQCTILSFEHAIANTCVCDVKKLKILI